jgi:hypothetical protein
MIFKALTPTIFNYNILTSVSFENFMYNGSSSFQNATPVGLEKKGLQDFFQVFFSYGQKNIFADLHVSGNSKTFLPLYYFF